MELMINLKTHQYPIYIEKQALLNINKYIKQVFNQGKLMVITDQNVFDCYGHLLLKQLEEEYEVAFIVLQPGEESKHFKNLEDSYRQCLDFKLSRTDGIIALGGGVVGDFAGFIAATYLRGIRYIQIPTTLLAQVDSSVGGKVAVDTTQGKNLVGAIYHPSVVVIDSTVLKTLDRRYLIDGMAEVIKYGCIASRKLFEQLEKYQKYEELVEDIDSIIYTCIAIKKQIVEKDEHDIGERLLLNFGHTIGHAIEKYYNYETYRHGEAVALGMLMMLEKAFQKEMIQEEIYKRVRTLIMKYGLPVDGIILNEEILNHITLDKKNLHAKLHVILIKEIGEGYVYQTDIDFLKGE